MGPQVYASVPYPWKAAIGLRTRGPSTFYARLVGQALVYGAPGRRLPRLHRAVPTGRSFEWVLARAPRRTHVYLDELALDLFCAWPRLVAAGERVPEDPGPLDLLALERRSAVTVFVFSDGSEPCLVAKLPRVDGNGVDAEVAALLALEGLGVAARFLGTVRRARVQEVVPGDPLEVSPMAPGDLAHRGWEPRLEALAAALFRIADATATEEPPTEAFPERARDGSEHPDLAPRTRFAIAEAMRRAEGLQTSVLKHSDLSPQNCLYEGPRFAGFVDWERAIPTGTPIFDLLNGAMAYLELGFALGRGGKAAVCDAISAAWRAVSDTGCRLRGVTSWMRRARCVSWRQRSQRRGGSTAACLQRISRVRTRVLSPFRPR